MWETGPQIEEVWTKDINRVGTINSNNDNTDNNNSNNNDNNKNNNNNNNDNNDSIDNSNNNEMREKEGDCKKDRRKWKKETSEKIGKKYSYKSFKFCKFNCKGMQNNFIKFKYWIVLLSYFWLIFYFHAMFIIIFIIN